MLVDVGNDGTDTETSDLTTGVQSSESSTGRVVEIFLPSWECLETRDDTALIYSVRK